MLQNFPLVPSKGQVTLGGRDGDLVHVSIDGNAYTDMMLPGYPQVTVSKDLARTPTSDNAFISHTESLWIKTLSAWYEVGISAALEEIKNSSDAPRFLSALSRKMLALMKWANNLYPFLTHFALSSEDIVTKYSTINCWQMCPIRAFAWHPHTVKFAYALQDDSVRVHTTGNALVPLLKHKLQKTVADLAWQQFSAAVLAVACRSCILIWHVEPMSLAERPSASCVQILQQKYHFPVTSLSWSPAGDILLSASPVDTAIMAWNVAMEIGEPLRRLGGGGVTDLCWSPDGTKVFAASPSSVFRVWETKNWTCERWTVSSGRCQTACWDSSGTVLLFATDAKPVVYALYFSSSTDNGVIGGMKEAEICMDLTPVTLSDGQDCHIRVGGLIQQLAWDPTSSRLAVMFQDPDRNNRNLIALFRTRQSHSMETTPCGWIQGNERDVACYMCFQPKFSNGALLTVVWFSGTISHIPLYFIGSSKIGGPIQAAPLLGPQPEPALYSNIRFVR